MQGPWPPRLTIHLHLGRATGQPLGCFRQILLREFYYVICNNLWVCMYRCLVFLVALPLLVTACKREENNALQMMSDSSTTSVEKQIRDRFALSGRAARYTRPVLSLPRRLIPTHVLSTQGTTLELDRGVGFKKASSQYLRVCGGTCLLLQLHPPAPPPCSWPLR